MDNLTHTLIGLAAGELVARTTRADSGGLAEATRRTSLLVIGMVGSNLPDSDLLWSMGGDRLNYELNHRGYTHTLVACVALCLLLYAAVLAVLRWRGLRVSTRDHWVLAGTALISVLLHLGMDSLNSYGVHPFWPFDNHWYYGDAVFIVEPLYWVAAAPLLLVLRTRTPRILLGVVLLIGNVAILVVHRFAPAWALVPLVTLLLVWCGRALTARYTALLSCVLMAGVTSVFLLASMAVTRQVNAMAQQQFPDFTTLDQIKTPSPAQPLCWDVLLVQRKDDQYAVRTGQFAMSANHGAAVCPQLGASPPDNAAEPATMLWSGKYTMSLMQFNTLMAADCRARESLQFVRAPYLAQTGKGWALGDLRFGGADSRGLGAVLLRPDAQDDCHYHVPWLPPRGDLLTPVR